jgi:ParB/Sulfiredoxin domain
VQCCLASDERQRQQQQLKEEQLEELADSIEARGLIHPVVDGDIPVIRIGRMMRVPIVALERMLEEARPTSREST